MDANQEKLKFEKLNYNSYLKIPQLLSIQNLLSEPPHHDEMFFIIIHQAAELWFKEILHETDALVKAFQTHTISRALKVLRRISAIMALQVQQINLLATLTPAEFAGFRDRLRPASGFQSLQFRLIEYAYGVRDPFFLKFFETMPEGVSALEEWKDRPSVYEEFIQCLNKNAPYSRHSTDAAKPGSEETREAVVSQLRDIYHNPGENYHWILLFESMLDFDEKFCQWRSTHVLMVGRTIGMKKGTGGSSGYQFLQSRLDYRFFPELWEVRTKIGLDY